MGKLISITNGTKRGRRPISGFSGIRIAINNAGALKSGEPRYALVLTFYNGIDRVITNGDYIDVAQDSDYPDRLYIVPAIAKEGRMLVQKKCKRGSTIKTSHFCIKDRENWEKWIGSYTPVKEAERDIYYVDLTKKVV